jgi:hypothetical protein
MIAIHQALLVATWLRWCAVSGLPAAQALLWQPLPVLAHLIGGAAAMIWPGAYWPG